MKKRVPIVVTVIIALVCCIITFQVTHIVDMITYRYTSFGTSGELNSKLNELDSIYRQITVRDIDEDKLVYGTLYGYLLGTGDQYAEYIPKEYLQDYIDSLNGDGVALGISVEFSSDEKSIRIVKVLENSGAMEAGIEPEDVIIALDGKTVEEMGYYGTLAAAKGEDGTKVVLTVYKGGDENNKKEITVTRKKMPDTSVAYCMYEKDGKNYAIIYISGFNAYTSDQFKNALYELKEKNPDGYIFDVRENNGGQLDSLINVLDYILPECLITTMIDSAGNKTEYSTKDAEILEGKIAVLTNGDTASAAELFTICLKDYGVATVIGTKTYGKGCALNIYELSDGSALKMTSHMFNPPKSDNFDGVGIDPDILEELTGEISHATLSEYTPSETDNQLLKAIEIINNAK